MFILGNPLSNDLHLANDFFYGVFIIFVPLSIILSGVYAYKNKLSKGFIYVSLIILAFFLMILWFFGDPLTRIIVLLVGIIATIPSEYYMITTNK